MKNTVILYTVCALFLASAISCKKMDGLLSKEINVDDYIPAAANQQLVRHKYYLLSYDEDSEQAAWALYVLAPKTLDTDIERTDNFRLDPEVASGSAGLQDYKGSGFDRGHLVPAADMKLSPQAMSESFYLSNMSPQRPAFNRGIWKRLESQLRNWALEYGKLVVVTAGILDGGAERIGTNQVLVPEYFYKIAYDPRRQTMIGFVLPNRRSKQSLQEYVSSVDHIEEQTGLDFFPKLPDALENRLESANNDSQWF